MAPYGRNVRINETTLSGAQCVLSPFGTYPNANECNTSTNCGLQWRCAKAGGEVDPISGQTVAAGNPVRAHDGEFPTAEECLCFACINETCGPTDGNQGDYATEDACLADTDRKCGWKFGCGANGVVERRPPTEGGVWEVVEDATCFVCNNDGTVSAVAPGQQGTVRAAGECRYSCDGAGNRVVDPASNNGYDDAYCIRCNPDGTQEPVPAGGGGDVHPGDVCTYSCDSSGNRVFDRSSVYKFSAAQCWRCSGNAGPESSCEVAPAGDGAFKTEAECNANPTAQCGWWYECDGAGGTTLAPRDAGRSQWDGTTRPTCWTCTGGSGPAGSCNPVAAGSVGTYETKAACDANPTDQCGWWHECDGAGSTRLAPRNPDGNQWDDPAAALCYTCDGAAGPTSACTTVPAGGRGAFVTAAECDADPTAQCGWGYGCVDESCQISSTAARGRTEAECQFDDDAKCGWKFGCFSNFVCRNNVCVGVTPEDIVAGETVYASEAECVTASNGTCRAPGGVVCPAGVSIEENSCMCPANSAGQTCEVDCNPVSGPWQFFRQQGPTRWAATFWSNAEITFALPELRTGMQEPRKENNPLYPELDNPTFRAQERLWYTSNQVLTPQPFENLPQNNSPILELGFRRLDAATVEMVVQANVWNNNSYVPTAEGGDATLPNNNNIRGLGHAVIELHAPVEQCFHVPSLDFELFVGAEYIQMQLLAQLPFTETAAVACQSGVLQGSTCVCDPANAVGPACSYTRDGQCRGAGAPSTTNLCNCDPWYSDIRCQIPSFAITSATVGRTETGMDLVKIVWDGANEEYVVLRGMTGMADAVEVYRGMDKSYSELASPQEPMVYFVAFAKDIDDTTKWVNAFS